MKRSFFVLAISGATVLAAACGGGDAASEPPNVPTTPQTSNAGAAERRAHVATGAVTEAPSDAVATTSGRPPTATPNTPAPSGTTAGRPPVPVTSPTTSPYPTLPPGPCDACQGSVTPELQSALNKRAQDTRGCYVSVLTNHPAARASLNVELRIGRDGTSCDAFARVEPPEWPGLSECVLGEFRKGGYPVPGKGSCVIARVPLLFTPEQ